MINNECLKKKREGHSNKPYMRMPKWLDSTKETW